MKTIKMIHYILSLPFRVVLFVLSPFLLLVIFLTTDLDSKWDIDFSKKSAKKVISLGLWK